MATAAPSLSSLPLLRLPSVDGADLAFAWSAPAEADRSVRSFDESFAALSFMGLLSAAFLAVSPLPGVGVGEEVLLLAIGLLSFALVSPFLEEGAAGPVRRPLREFSVAGEAYVRRLNAGQQVGISTIE
ncbi:hypothetical protein [Novosphingobium sp.]|uniref:hypothetical protein n=1 Tax=Novosphingobium sp. TaxID=1874826 RepID=UPI002FDE29C4